MLFARKNGFSSGSILEGNNNIYFIIIMLIDLITITNAIFSDVRFFLLALLTLLMNLFIIILFQAPSSGS